MEAIIEAIITAFRMLVDTKLFEIPLLVWFLLPVVIGIVLKFINGKK